MTRRIKMLTINLFKLKETLIRLFNLSFIFDTQISTTTQPAPTKNGVKSTVSPTGMYIAHKVTTVEAFNAVQQWRKTNP